MKFDFCIGNPPYQESKGGTKNVDIWPYFIRESGEIASNTILIRPGRWLVPKKQMKSVHDMIIQRGLVSFNYYPNSQKIFQNVSIDGGVTVTLLKHGHDGEIKYFNEGKYIGIFDDNSLFISNEFESEAYIKTHSFAKEIESIQHRILGNVGSLQGGEFGYSKQKHIDFLRKDPTGMKHPLKVWANGGYGKGTRYEWHFVDATNIGTVPEKLLSSRKVMLDKKGHAITSGSGNIINNIPAIVDKLAIASGDVLFVMPDKDTDYELQLIKSMFMTKTVRFLMSITQKDLCVRGFENVPDYTYFVPMLKGGLFTDKWFYETFKFSKELINHIESNVSSKIETQKA